MYSVRALGNAQNCCHFVLDLLKHGGEYAAVQLQGKTGSLFPSSSELTFYDPHRALFSTAYTPFDVVHRLRGVQGGLKGLQQRELDFLDVSDSRAVMFSLMDPERWFHPIELMNASVAVGAPWDSSAVLPLCEIFRDRELHKPLSQEEWENVLLDPNLERCESVSSSGCSASRARAISTASASSASGYSRRRSMSSAERTRWSLGDWGSFGEESEQIVVRPSNRTDFLVVYATIPCFAIPLLPRTCLRSCVRAGKPQPRCGCWSCSQNQEFLPNFARLLC